MNNSKVLTARFMNDKISDGWMLNQFLQHFECSEEEFKDKLFTLYKHEKGTPNKMWNRIVAKGERANRRALNRAKKSQKKYKKKCDSISVDVNASALDVESNNFIAPVYNDKVMSDEGNFINENVTLTSKSLEDLINEKEVLLGLLAEKKKLKKQKVAEENVKQKELININKSVEKLERELEKLINAAEKIFSQRDEINLTIAECDTDISEYRDKVKQIELEIKKKSVVNISFGSSHDEIKFDYIVDQMDISKSDINNKIFEILQDDISELLEEMPMQNVKIIAKFVLAFEKIKKEKKDKPLKCYFSEKNQISEVFEFITGENIII